MRELKISLEEIVNHALRNCRGKCYYFDENGIYKKISSTEARVILNNVYTRCDGSIFSRINNDIRNKVNLNTFNKALGKMRVGDTFDELKELYQKVEFEHYERPEALDRFITKIDLPKFIRMPENQDSEVFDFIHIDAFVVTEWESDIYKYILKNRKKIIDKVVNRLKTDKCFKTYSVPINFLKLSEVTYSKSKNLIRFVFELKNSHV